MSADNTNTLLQGLFICGSYEKGQVFINENAADITREFVSALRATSMNLLTEEQAASDLALIFADLAFVAAVVINDDKEKGMARYCKGTILVHRGNYRAAISSYEEAEAYLIQANSNELANCLFDHAGCHYKLGELSRALRLLEEALPYQTVEEARAETVALMLGLEEQIGNLSDADIKDLLSRVSFPSSRRKVEVRETSDPQEKDWICTYLANHHPALQNKMLFRSSIPYFLSSSHYGFFLAEDSDHTVDKRPPYALGLFKQYRDTFNDRDILGLEAVYFADSDSQLHLNLIIEGVKKMAQARNIQVVYIPEKSLSHVRSFHALLRWSGREKLNSMPMQGAQREVYSAFTENPDTSFFLADCIAFQFPQWDFGGKLAADMNPLYRGEGRLKYRSNRERWQFSRFEELSEYIFSHGFRARIEGGFTGSVKEQLLHQGYVGQPTVSLSKSPEISAYYATDKHTREGGIVFTVDTAALMQRGRVYDSLGTLKKTCPWVAGGFYDLIVRIMKSLDTGREDVHESGAFLAMCHAESRRRVESFGGGQTFGPAVDWSKLLDDQLLSRLGTHGISRQDLDAMNEEFEIFWNIALGQMIGEERIDIESGLVESIQLSRAYFQAFDEIQLKLKEQWVLNQFSRYNHPGWDLSPFGYITKTIRDKEFFSDGDLPGDCILDAKLVDRMGQEMKVIRNQSAAGK